MTAREAIRILREIARVAEIAARALTEYTETKEISR